MEEAESCPFCGTPTVYVDSARAPDEGYRVVCSLCDACGPLAESASTAVEVWNDRS